MMLLYDIEVLESYRRQGVGAAMVNLLKGLCREHNVYKMWVLTTKSNKAARSLYTSTGGTPATDDDVTFVYDLDAGSNQEPPL